MSKTKAKAKSSGGDFNRKPVESGVKLATGAPPTDQMPPTEASPMKQHHRLAGMR